MGASPLGPRALARRRKILDAATRLFARQGIERSTVEHLLEEAGIARATFYRAFPSLDAVVEALYAEYEADVIRRLAIDLGNVGERGLEAVVDGVLDEHQNRGTLIRAMYREEIRPGRTMASQHARVGAQVAQIADWWRQSTQSEPDEGLILALILLLQAGGLYSQELPSADRAQLREALLRTVNAVVEAHRRTLQG